MSTDNAQLLKLLGNDLRRLRLVKMLFENAEKDTFVVDRHIEKIVTKIEELHNTVDNST